MADVSLRRRHNERDGVSNHQPHDCLLNRFIQAQMKENIKAPRNWPLWGEFTADRWIPRTNSNAENVSIWWRHHGCAYIFTARGRKGGVSWAITRTCCIQEEVIWRELMRFRDTRSTIFSSSGQLWYMRHVVSCAANPRINLRLMRERLQLPLTNVLSYVRSLTLVNL